MKASMSKSGFAVIAAAVVLLSGQWASAGNLPTWGAATQPQPIQQPQPTIISQPAANIAPSVQAPQPGTWTAPGTTSTPTVVTPTQQPRSFQPRARSKVTPRTGFTNRAFNLQPKAVSRHLEQRASGFGPQLPPMIPPISCSEVRQTHESDWLNRPIGDTGGHGSQSSLQAHAPRLASHADLHCTDLTPAYLLGAVLEDADLRGANLSGVDLSRANLVGAVLADADLTGATLNNMEISRANFNRTKLINADLLGGPLGNHLPYNGYTDFRGAIIDNMYYGVSIKKGHFDGLDFRKLRKRERVGVDGLQHVYIMSNFSQSTLSNTNFSGVVIKGADFSGAYMARSSFNKTYIASAKFSGADLSLSDFSGATLGFHSEHHEGLVDFEKAYLTDANFSGATLENVDFTKANLVGANFSGTVMNNIVWSKAIMPDGKVHR